MYDCIIPQHVNEIHDFRRNAYIMDKSLKNRQINKLIFDHWDLKSKHLLLRKHSVPIGCIRVTSWNAIYGLPWMEEARSYIIPEYKSIEISRIFILPEFRKTRAIFHLIKGLSDMILELTDGNCNIFIDVLKNSRGICLRTYNILGFKPINIEYYDYRYSSRSCILNLDKYSVAKLKNRINKVWKR